MSQNNICARAQTPIYPNGAKTHLGARGVCVCMDSQIDPNIRPDDCDTSKQEYTLVLRPEPSDIPSIIRLRRFLKAALRSYGMRCTSIQEQPPETPARDRATQQEASQ